MNQQNSFLFKVLILGDQAVGKSCLLLQYCDKNFVLTHMPTIGIYIQINQIKNIQLGIDFKQKSLQIQDKVIKLQLWDTAGQERFKTITNTLYNGVMGIALVYSVENRKAFENISSWMKQIKDNVGDAVQIILIANKSDIQDKVIQGSEGQRLADEFKISFFQTSAKTGENVEKAFDHLAMKILQNVKNNNQLQSLQQQGQGVKIKTNDQKEHNKKKKCGCS
ncbi:ras oncogene family protein, putative [Ichthyophthirius multifiliis]|uniref:Ras oncogene family protein, putative n=1 Tax=Ichthyophthirius multifiliis TaxID=5932 RepID=G0R0H1_ICHMU|nr:ras oncogene family protein, putative [Ichthyophthirius multifiliis]EGR29022.1 ras oncogene family protein, putative [Ichthyophthirius multifiliis]|eukprot:XP_004030258.1 ras oncogene family protein, putative [Ichthyophthirius multifiliis]